MKFKYYKIPSKVQSNGKAFLKPLIPIILINDKNKFPCWALIDSGSDYNIFPEAIALKLGINNIDNNKPMKIHRIANSQITVFVHNIKICIGGWEFPMKCGFSAGIYTNFLLGQNNFFDLFRIVFDKPKEEIELIPRK